MGSKARRNAPNYDPFTLFHVSPFGRSPGLSFRAFETVCECVKAMWRLFRLQWVCEKAVHCDRIVILRVDHKQTLQMQSIGDGQKLRGKREQGRRRIVGWGWVRGRRSSGISVSLEKRSVGMGRRSAEIFIFGGRLYEIKACVRECVIKVIESVV